MGENITVSKRALWSTLALAGTLLFTYFQIIGYLIPGFEQIFSIKEETATLSNIGLMWVPIISYILISLNICLAINIFKKLEEWDEKGLVLDLICGFVSGLVVGLVVGLIFGGLSGRLIGDFIYHLLLGIIVGLILGLILGLISGLKDEFLNS